MKKVTMTASLDGWGAVVGVGGRETGGKELGQEKRRGRMAQNDGERHLLSVTNLPDP